MFSSDGRKQTLKINENSLAHNPRDKTTEGRTRNNKQEKRQEDV